MFRRGLKLVINNYTASNIGAACVTCAIYKQLIHAHSLSSFTGGLWPVLGTVKATGDAEEFSSPSRMFSWGKKKDEGDKPSKRMTREATREASVRDEKERYKKMSQEEKRELYKCGNRFVTLDKVLTWPEYLKENAYKLHKNAKGKPPRKIRAEINEKINSKVSLWQGDITKLEIDSIANAANNSLMGGGGVDGAIHSAAGASKLHAECGLLGGCDTGDAKITSGYNLPAKYILHTVGPIGKYEKDLKSCYVRCLKLVADHGLLHTAFPCISTGIYGYPSKDAAPVAIGTVRHWLEEHGEHVERIIFCLFLKEDVDIYEELMPLYFPVTASDAPQSEEAPPSEEALPSGDAPQSKRASAEEAKAESASDSEARSQPQDESETSEAPPGEREPGVGAASDGEGDCAMADDERETMETANVESDKDVKKTDEVAEEKPSQGLEKLSVKGAVAEHTNGTVCQNGGPQLSERCQPEGAAADDSDTPAAVHKASRQTAAL